MNKTIGNPIYYYYRSGEEDHAIFASFDPIPESEITDYIGKRFLFTDVLCAVPRHRDQSLYDLPPYFFDGAAVAGCVAACEETNVQRHEIASPLTGSFLLAWAYDTPNVGTTPKYGNIVLVDEEGFLQLTFKRAAKQKGIEISFHRMIVENHEWNETYFDPKLTFCGKTFEQNESWRLSLCDWHELVVPLMESTCPNPILTFRAESDFDDDEERSFRFRYLDRRFFVV